MIGSTLSIVLLSVTFALLTFALAYIIVATISADKIAAEKRLEELNKKEGDGGEVALVKNESKTTRLKRARKRQRSDATEKVGSVIYKELQSADIKMRPEEFLLIWILLIFVPGSLVALFTNNVVFSLILIVVGLAGPVVYIKMKQKKRVKEFEEQLSDALMICVSCLHSGLSFTQAMETIAADMDDPISTEFALTIKEMNMGYSMDEALENLGTRMKSKFVDLMISAVLVQRQTGGNLSRILENISDTIKEKMKLKKQLKTATASGRTSGLIVGMMPIILAVLFIAVNRDIYGILIREPRGYIILAVVAGLETLAFISIKKITNVKM